jgi:hypothetical protein
MRKFERKKSIVDFSGGLKTEEKKELESIKELFVIAG